MRKDFMSFTETKSFGAQLNTFASSSIQMGSPAFYNWKQIALLSAECP